MEWQYEIKWIHRITKTQRERVRNSQRDTANNNKQEVRAALDIVGRLHSKDRVEMCFSMQAAESGLAEKHKTRMETQ